MTYGKNEKNIIPKNCKVIPCFVLGLLLFSAAIFIENAHAQGEGTQQSINYLIRAVAQSNLIFIRNGEKHTSTEAAAHIKEKYDYFRSRIETPEDFIRLCASKSLLSGKPYMVVTRQGTIPTAEWLGRKLTEHVKTRQHG